MRPGTGSVHLKHAASGGMNASLHLLGSPLRGRNARQVGVDVQVTTVQPALRKGLEHPNLHARKAADVGKGSFAAQQLVELGQGAIQVVVDVLTLAAVESDFSANHGVVSEIGVVLGHLAEEVVVDQVAGVRRSHHQVHGGGAWTPCGVHWASLRRANEQLMNEPAERSDAGTGGEQQVVVGVAVGGQDESLACWAGHWNGIALAQVADVVGAHPSEEAMVGGVVLGSLRLAFGKQALASG